MTELVALALPGGPDYVEAIRRVWDTGDAIAPLDHRLPRPEAEKVLAALAPDAIIEADGERRSLAGHQPWDHSGHHQAMRPLADGDAAVIATSGTTGQPKAVIHTHSGIEASAYATSKALAVDPDSDRWLGCLPLAHIGGLAVVMRSLVTGTQVEVHDGFEPQAVIDAARRGATLVSLVTRALAQIDPAAFRRILIGGAAPPPDRPANVIATYGMTETGSGVLYDQTPLDGLEIDITDDDEIRLRGPMLFRAYRHDPDPFDADGWFPTGDLGQVDNNGVLSVHGRRGDVIVTGGEKVWPAPIEGVLGQHPQVAEVALVGIPHPEWGHEVVAFVVPSNHDTPPQLEPLRTLVKQQFGPWCAPRRLELVTALPKTALGKVKRDELARGR